jgi:tetratricopeptide (TPR) repeat protein
LDERDEAVAIYNEALTHHPKEATIWFERGVSLSRMKRFDEALASYQRAAQIDSKNKTYNVSAGYMLAMMGRHDEAMVWMRRVMSDASARYTLALALRKQGQHEKGRQQLSMALRLEPKHQPSLELMARWDDTAFQGGDEPLQQTSYTPPSEAKVIAPASPTAAVVIQSPTNVEVPAVTNRQPAVEGTSRPAEKADVNWNKAGASSVPKAESGESAPQPLIPVLSEHWEKKPTAPPPLTGPTPSKQGRVAKLGFDDQP